jgi:polysaccharide deacetylase family protein (PEP-CTERM system associated)
MMSPIKNVLSVDVEDYFQVEAFASAVSYDDWDSFQCRVEHNVFRILELFANRGAVGTFFVLGWVARRFPKLVREIAVAGHEIGSHGYAHQRLLKLGPDAFRKDLKASIACLSDEVAQPITSYRAPSFSIVKRTFWALDILAEEGIRCDSSIFPVRHDLYGVPDGRRFPYWHPTAGGGRIFEFPPSTVRVAGQNWGVGGGGYLRLLPYWTTHRALRHINQVEQQPAMVYFHPWELDPEQPRIRARLRSKIRHYTNLSTMERKVQSLLADFQFTTLSDACRVFEGIACESSHAPAAAEMVGASAQCGPRAKS